MPPGRYVLQSREAPANRRLWAALPGPSFKGSNPFSSRQIGTPSIGWVGTPGLVILGGSAIGNVVEGNIIGLDASASHAPFVPPGGRPVGGTQEGGQWIGVWIANGSGNRIGGGVGAGNIIAGNAKGVEISGSLALGNVVAGNRIGWSPTYGGNSSLQASGVTLDTGTGQNTVGGDAGYGNTMGGIGRTAVAIFATDASETVAGNWIGVLPDSKTLLPANNSGIFLVD